MEVPHEESVYDKQSTSLASIEKKDIKLEKYGLFLFFSLLNIGQVNRIFQLLLITQKKIICFNVEAQSDWCIAR